MSDKSETRKYEPPKPTGADTAHLVVKAAISAIPTLGGPAAELFAALIAPPLERRRQAWMEEVAEALRRLENQRKVSIEELQEDETFIDTLLHASQAAMRTHQQEKRDALRNAVLNSALPNPPDESLRLVFLSLVDQFTVWHLRLLKLFQDPEGWAKKHNRNYGSIYMGGLSSILEIAYPELRGRREFYDQVWRDLYLRGLVNTESLHTMMTATGLMTKRTTDLGDRFLKFIEEPEDLTDKGES